MSVLVCENVSKSTKNNEIIHSFSYNFLDNQIYAIMGNDTKKQNELLNSFKKKYPLRYKSLNRSYIIYIVFSIITILSLGIVLYDLMIGAIIFSISFLAMLVSLYFYKLANENYVKFLSKKKINYYKKRRL